MNENDYLITEGDNRHYASRDTVVNRLLFLYPALVNDILMKMRDGEAFEYVWSGVEIKIEDVSHNALKGVRP